jgi:aspartate/methionine/tyrosine aminotransferase
MLPLKPSKLEKYLSTYAFKAQELLCLSDCDPRPISQFWSEDLLDLPLGYSDPQGIFQFREDIAKTNFKNLKAADISVTNGGEEAIFLSFISLLKTGDEVIVQRPHYASLEAIPRSLGCEIKCWEARSTETGWIFDLDDLKKQFSEKTKLLVINFPHNPTGAHINNNELKSLKPMVEARNIYVLSDEVYRGLEYNKEDTLPSFADIYEKAISIGSLSKTLGTPGLRTGWLATQDINFLEKVASSKAYTSISPPQLNQILGQRVLAQREKILIENTLCIQKNLKILDSFAQDFSDCFQINLPQAGPVLFPKIKFGASASQFCKNLFSKTGVLLLPSTEMDYGSHHLRMGLGRSNFPRALEKLSQFMRQEKIFAGESAQAEHFVSLHE